MYMYYSNIKMNNISNNDFFNKRINTFYANSKNTLM